MFSPSYKLLIGFFLIFFGSIAKAQDTVSHDGTVGLKYANVPYKAGANLSAYEKERCKLDIYIPAQQRKNVPVLVFFHGGGLTSGDKTEGWKNWGNNFGYEFLKKGIAVVSVNYRLSGEKAKWPEYLNDAAAAVAWVYKNIASYGGNANAVFVSGFSAGGYLTHMLSVDPQWYKNVGFNDRVIRGYIPISGQPKEHPTVAKDLGIEKSELSTKFKYAMPLGNVKKGKAPILIITGGNEGQTIVDNQTYYKSLKSAGRNIDIYIEPGKGHLKMRDSLGDSVSVARQKIVEFINRYKKD